LLTIRARVGSVPVVRSGSTARALTEKRLREAIARGDMVPGQRLVEADLMRMYGVTRGSVRLALEALVAEGLVERVPNRGARVRRVSAEEAVAITECRMALESLIARKAAERATDRQIAMLRAHGVRLEQALEDGDLPKYSSLIEQLYGLVHEMGRQPVAGDLVARLQAQLVRHQFQLSLRPGRPQRSLRELFALVEAVAERSPDRAEAATVAHFHEVIAALEQCG
jgi:DNA-binding GntR family transcriptional regulator